MLNKVQIYLTIFLLAALSNHVKAQGVVLHWAKLAGGTGADFGMSVATDNWGNVYATGSFSDSVDFDPGPGITKLGASGQTDIFLTKFDAAGNFKWAKSFGNSNEDKGFAVETDDWGNVYITGQCAMSVNFNPGGTGGTLSGGNFSDVFVAKYDSSGNYSWARRMGSPDPEDDIAYSIDVDGDGNVYVTGQYSGTADFDPGPGTAMLTSSGNSDVFISKLDSAGIYVWAKSMGGAAWFDYGYSIDIDKNGNVYTVGVFKETADFDPGPGTATLTSAGGSWDVFLSKLNAQGNFEWAKRIGSTGEDFGYGVAVSDSGHVYITGHYSNTVDFDPGPGTTNLTSVGGTDVFIAKYDLQGEMIWAKSIGGSSFDFVESINVDKRGNAYAIGFFFPSIDLDPSAATANFNSNGDNDVYIVKLDFNGNYKWGKTIGGTGMDVGQEIVIDDHGSVYTTGYVENTVDFDPNTGVSNLTSVGGWDFYVHKMICVDTSSSNLVVDICQNTYNFAGTVYNASGVYTHNLTNLAGCDSTVTLNLTLKGLLQPPVINVNVFVLSTTLPYFSYQWYKNGVLIPGATSATYTVTANGDYTVVVANDKGCTDTSALYRVDNYTGIKDHHYLKNVIKVYPNPATDQINVSSPVPVKLSLYSIEGRIIGQESNTRQISLKGAADGIYLLRIADKEDNLIKVEKVIKQNR